MPDAKGIAQLAGALSHPIRIDALLVVYERGTTTPKEIARHVEAPLGVVSYHMRCLAKAGFLLGAGEIQCRGAVAHRYKLSAEGRRAITAITKLDRLVS